MKTREPIFRAQVEQTPFNHFDWFTAMRAEAEAKGFTFFRFSIHPTNMDIALIEGWETQPDDQGNIRFMIGQPISSNPTKE